MKKEGGMINQNWRKLLLLTMLFIGIIIMTQYNYGWVLERLGKRKSQMETEAKNGFPEKAAAHSVIDLSGEQIIPKYVDLMIGEELVIRNGNGSISTLIIDGIVGESHNAKAPRSKVILKIDGEEFTIYCGMVQSNQQGIAPLEVNSIKISVEVTQQVFSNISRKKTFNSYSAFRLQKDARLSIWDSSRPILADALGTFIVEQTLWPKERYGNWLHRTSYGLHSAIDVFTVKSGVPEIIRSPIEGTCYTYNKGASPNSSKIMKHVNIYSDAEVGPQKGKILLRFLHLSKIIVNNGDHVSMGQAIGYTGHTGFPAYIGDHLHFEIRLNPAVFGLRYDENILASIPVNPYPFLLEWWKNTESLRITE
jgi:hypothetical protein